MEGFRACVLATGEEGMVTVTWELPLEASPELELGWGEPVLRS